MTSLVEVTKPCSGTGRRCHRSPPQDASPPSNHPRTRGAGASEEVGAGASHQSTSRAAFRAVFTESPRRNLGSTGQSSTSSSHYIPQQLPTHSIDHQCHNAVQPPSLLKSRGFGLLVTLTHKPKQVVSQAVCPVDPGGLPKKNDRSNDHNGVPPCRHERRHGPTHRFGRTAGHCPD